MKARILLLPLALLFLLAFTHCAKRGRPSGGAIDSIPPKPLRMSPSNYTTKFDSDKIIIHFDEYIRLDKLQENLIISPPMEKMPNISPYNTSKTLEINIDEQLQPNTTYTFNFGNSIIDNNEGNVLEQFEYVFSTGNYLDSLNLKGKIIDSRLLKLKNRVGVNLYRMDDNFHDSIITKGKPNYITVTDEEGNFTFTNLASGEYLLTAIQKKNEGNSYSYNPAEDKFAFNSEIIQVPNDTIQKLFLYKEKARYKLHRSEMTHENIVRFAYQSDGTIPKIKLQNTSDEIKTRIIKEMNKDTLDFWFNSKIEKDSLLFSITYRDTTETVRVRRKKDLQKKDFKIHNIEVSNPHDTLKLRLDTPIGSINEDFMELTDRDSVNIPFTTDVNFLNNLVYINFEKEYENNYHLRLLPNAIIDWEGTANDTVQYRVRTKAESDYGSLHLNLHGIEDFPVIVEILDSNSKTIRSEYLTENRQINFLHLNSGTYFVRLSFDLNKNKKWDSGNFEKRLQPEPVYFFHTPIEVHANWSVNENLRLDN